MKTKVIVVIGPTAIGKTALGIDLAQRYNGEIISGDSQQVYRKLDIGTAKASPEEQAVAVHQQRNVSVCQHSSFLSFSHRPANSQVNPDQPSAGRLPGRYAAPTAASPHLPAALPPHRPC